MNKQRLIKSHSIYSTKAINPEDIESIRVWRNSQMDVLRQKTEISREQQIEYFDNVIFPEYEKDQPQQVLYSFFENEALVGYGGLVNISWLDKRAEMSFLVDSARAKSSPTYNNDLTAFILITKRIAFEEFDFHRLFVETYSFRTFHIEILERSGFVLEGRMRNHIIENGQFHDSLIHGIVKEDYEQG